MSPLRLVLAAVCGTTLGFTLCSSCWLDFNPDGRISDTVAPSPFDAEELALEMFFHRFTAENTHVGAFVAFNPPGDDDPRNPPVGLGRVVVVQRDHALLLPLLLNLRQPEGGVTLCLYSFEVREHFNEIPHPSPDGKHIAVPYPQLSHVRSPQCRALRRPSNEPRYDHDPRYRGYIGVRP